MARGSTRNAAARQAAATTPVDTEQEDATVDEGAGTEQAQDNPQEDAVTDTDTATTPFDGEWLDELPGITRSQESGVWSKRLEGLDEQPGKWKAIAPTKKAPHPTVNMLRSGKAAGVNPDNYEFAGRTVEGQGYVFARFLTPELREERDKRVAERKAKAAAKAQG